MKSITITRVLTLIAIVFLLFGVTVLKLYGFDDLSVIFTVVAGITSVLGIMASK